MNEREIRERICRLLGMSCGENVTVEELLDLLEAEFKEYRKSLEEQAIFMEAQLEELSKSYEEIATLFQVSEILGAFEYPLKLGEKLEKVIELLRNAVGFQKYLVFVKREGLVLGDVPKDEVERIVKDTSKTVLIEPGMNELVENMLFVPIRGSEDYGYVCLVGKEKGGIFTAGDRRLTESVAKQIAAALDRVLFVERERERQRMEEQMEIARKIQRSLFPKRIPRTKRIELFAFSKPAIQVGGDYYDVFEREKGLLVVVGDVAGKGIPAALLMSSLRSYLKLMVKFFKDLSELVCELNKILCEDLTDDRFVTMVFLEIEEDGRVSIVNAGHNPVYVVRNGELVRLESTGIPLGISEWRYRRVVTTVKPNSFLVLYTDGVTEARNVEREEYGYQRLERLLRRAHGSAENLVDDILRDVQDFTAGQPLHDDVTVLVIKYSG